MKYPPKPPIPPKMPYIEKDGRLEQRCDWQKIAKDYAQRLKKVLRKNGKENLLDMSDAIIKRRVQVLVKYTEKIIERYKGVPGFELENRDQTGDEFIQFNFFPVSTYNQMDNRAYLLFAASIWILDEIDSSKRKQFFMLLPRHGSDIDETWNQPDVWHACYEDDLIASVQYVLHCRNKDIAPMEVEDDNTERIFINSLIATDGQHEDAPSRQKFEQLMDLIPQESIERAVAYFEVLFWLWMDRYFDCLSLLNITRQKAIDKANQIADEYNQQREKLIAAVKEMTERQERQEKQARKPVVNPLLANPTPSAMQSLFQKFDPTAPINHLSNTPFRNANQADPVQRVFDIAERLMNISDRHTAAMEKIDEIDDRKNEFRFDLLRSGYLREAYCRDKYGNEVAERMKPLKITKPFEACFALLWLIENGSDLPWLYGCGCGLMEEVSESLPWGVCPYSDIHDPVWNPEEENEDWEQLSFLEEAPPKKKNVKPATIPEWYERKYVPNEDEAFRFNRSMAQIVYEETGCILPRDLHIYDSRQKEIRRYGLTGKEATALLVLFSTLGHARRSERAINFDQDVMEYWEQEESERQDIAEKDNKCSENEKPLTYEELSEKLRAEQENSKKLRSSLYESERTSRETRKELAAIRESAALDHRELADLRELIFNQENEEEDETPEQNVSNLFPYEVKKDTVVFGGHETWLKAIRPMLTGNIRFLDKDLNFNVNVIRNAEIVWIQPNAMSHTLYYKITDAARQYKKPVRYFSHASAAKGAAQVMEADLGRTKS